MESFFPLFGSDAVEPSLIGLIGEGLESTGGIDHFP